MRRLSLLFAAITMLLSPAACGRLPGGAPASEEILKTADNADADFALYTVTRAFIPILDQWPETGPKSTGSHSGTHRLPWIAAQKGSKTQIIQPGDLLTLRIWDSSDNSLLTSPEEKMVQLQDVTVAADGNVFIPYVGNVNVNGLTPALAREKLQSELETIVPSAQLQLDMTEGRGNSVDLVSGVETPGIYPMPDRNYTVMGLIAAGGGISASLNNPQIRLVRGRNIYGTSVEALLSNPLRDTLLQGGDRVFVEEDARYFLSFGATAREDLHIFTKDHMSAMDAMSVAGGFQDNRADPQGLLVLREYSDNALAPGQRGPRQTRVVFTLDLTSADGLFSARRFEINSGDLLIATEAPVNDALTISNIIGNFFGVFSRAGVL